MIFGGLEIVAGGYLIHRHYRKKNEEERLRDEAQERRHNTFPGANGPKNGWNTQAQHRPQHHQYQQQPVMPQQKYACYAPAPMPLPQYQYQAQAPVQHQPRPPLQPHSYTQSFNIPRRPLPQQKPEIIIQPSLQRTDSFATISRMPIANGSRPSDIPEQQNPVVPLRRDTTGGLQPGPQHSVYGNNGFSVSSPAFGATPTSPSLTYVMATEQDMAGRHTVDDNWETYGRNERPHYAPSVSTDLGERDPPPPYMP